MCKWNETMRLEKNNVLISIGFVFVQTNKSVCLDKRVVSNYNKIYKKKSHFMVSMLW
jgi:hypothetical protein